ncbi:L-threonine aldolase [Georgenia satyanarayanai]|uniref:L-threonine aldolase n=2 Tax=Georgenia satyanarayanai TaxID=860221 RepID=A0A2Y9ASR6_9MICO|nr:L-threonine aldolase [Georgenia satyanarayanai]SSA47106.1 L-threonine aldolase [Georgenia satyanarayanai]
MAPMTTRGFTSDNASGAHPAVLAALAAAAEGHAPSYGADAVTAALDSRAREVFGPDAAIMPVFNGTGANVVALGALLQKWDAVLTSEHAHVATDESTAPQLVAGAAVRTLPAASGKVGVADVAAVLAADDGSVHHARPAALSLTQSTELGTVYRPEELSALVAAAHGHGASVHVDGARLANAAARLGASLAALTTAQGVDVLSFGATKNGALFGDAIVVLDPALVEPVARLRKASTQLASKMRFVSAQLLALLTDDLWRTTARHANDAADHLAALLRSELGIEPVHPVEANAVFLPVPPAAVGTITAQLPVLAWDRPAGVLRAVCSFDTTEEDVRALVGGLARILG